MPRTFTHFAAIDWSGATGERHAGIAVALCAAGDAAPCLVAPPGGQPRWSRAEVLDWIVKGAPPATLIGFDMGISLAHADAGAFFPGWTPSPPDARALWAMVDSICADEAHLGVSAFVDHPDIARYFRRHGGREGDRFGANGLPDGQRGGQGRFRVAEQAQALAGCRPTSNFNLVGAGQVGKASLAGMRLLHRLPPTIPVWPIDPLPIGPGKLVTEIYTTIAALAGGRRAGASKIRDAAALTQALAALGSAPVIVPSTPLSDHAADALITAAWLRGHAHRPELWHPAALTPMIARTEGWTFGVP